MADTDRRPITLANLSWDYLGDLAKQGTHGTSIPDVAKTLIEEGIRTAIEKGYIKRRDVPQADLDNPKSFGMNWKMTAKTILVQLHHKIQTFESVNKHLVLVVQDRLLDYMGREFSFGHLNDARVADPMHFHPYTLKQIKEGHRLELAKRLSTDTAGIAICLGLQSEAKVDLDVILKLIEQKLTARTLFNFSETPPPVSVGLDE
jgi:hypothetical protein